MRVNLPRPVTTEYLLRIIQEEAQRAGFKVSVETEYHYTSGSVKKVVDAFQLKMERRLLWWPKWLVAGVPMWEEVPETGLLPEQTNDHIDFADAHCFGGSFTSFRSDSKTQPLFEKFLEGLYKRLEAPALATK